MTGDKARVLRADLHLHSYHSGRAGQLRFLRARDCYSEPDAVYAAAKARGMDVVTITDHDSVDGCLEFLERQPDADEGALPPEGQAAPGEEEEEDPDDEEDDLAQQQLFNEHESLQLDHTALSARNQAAISLNIIENPKRSSPERETAMLTPPRNSTTGQHRTGQQSPPE